ncbi:ead/Ea22-like family protein [Klebsiella pneumoniae]|uniref:ead/Ea22-like family protein n=1 Tax=Klebsiella pneumoniae TaxID=573 RepID=UPI000A16F367|nr:ead/Ea22-like family protein [Klebsiella pneumoniae]MBA2103603.1 hypothetical protein [Klebsiella pneumoniae subsp. pneumoniae]SVR96328.1 Ead domain protein [Klebsiella pneumoniae]SVU98130.1 Ead domain protein [Klebsiella pneumoniae]HDH0359954.1 ead/Ea22-like family protein [Klebsiella pneumoniae]HDH0612122.1 ead/Ea22-like family protein [Klebsiella pneumoniae]
MNSMTDITELAQSLKAAAENAGIEQWVSNHGEVNTADYEIEGGTYIDHVCNCEIVGTESPRGDFIALANPANVLALVEALEKAQAQIIVLQQKAEIDPRTHEIIDLKERIIETNDVLCSLLPDCRYMDPPDGGSVTPLEQVSRMIADYRHHITELESRIVKLPEAFYPDGDIDCPLVVNLDDVKEMLTTTGINWEAE